MATLTLAGHETTANTLTWALWELSKIPEFQEKMRAEIAIVRGKITERGDSDFTVEDLESMQYVNAALKVSSMLRVDTPRWLTRETGDTALSPRSLSLEPCFSAGRCHTPGISDPK